MATKTVRQYFRMICIDYLKSALAGPIRVLLNNPLALEIDPSAKNHNSETTANLAQTCQMFLDSIIKHAPEFPQ